jgi:hypothetical protein
MKMKLALSFFCSLFLSVTLFADREPDTILNLWPGQAPGPAMNVGEETDFTKPTDRLIAGRRIIKLGNVDTPQIYVFRPDPSGLKVEVIEENGEKKLRLTYPKSRSAGGVKIEVQSSPSLQGEFLPIDPEELLGERRQPDPAKPGVDRIELDLPLVPGAPSRFFRFNVKGEDNLPE